MTLENHEYGSGWLKCVVCGLRAPDVQLLPSPMKPEPRCADPKRCALVLRGEPLGGKPWVSR